MDRDVNGVSPVPIDNRIGDLKKGSKIFGIGYPAGLPEKVTGGAEIRLISQARITANWDSMKGSSGGPLFSQDSKKLISIFSSNQTFENYQYSKERNCMEVTKLNEIDDDLSVESCRIDTILQLSPKEVQDAVSGKKALASIPGKFSPMRAGVRLTVTKESAPLYKNPQIGISHGELALGTHGCLIKFQSPGAGILISPT